MPILSLLILSVFSGPLYSQEQLIPTKVFGSIAKINGQSSKNGKERINRIVEAIGRHYSNFDYEVVPFRRSIGRLRDADVDFQYPILKGDVEDENIIYSSFTTGQVKFALFYHKDVVVTKEDITDEKQRVIPIVEDIHQKFFPFKVKASTCEMCIMKQINNKRNIAGIYALGSGSYIIEKENLKNVKYTLFDIYYPHFTFKNNEKGRMLDAQFRKIILKLKKEGSLPILNN